MKALGYILLVAALGWFLYVLGVDMLAFTKDEYSLFQAIGHSLLIGGIPLAVLATAGGGLVYASSKTETEGKSFEYEQQIVKMINKEPRLRLRDILKEIPLNIEQLRPLLISMGDRSLFKGYIDWKNNIIVTGDEAVVSPGECPVCNGMTAAETPKTAVCTLCDAHIYGDFSEDTPKEFGPFDY
jgi:hypothetical protein